MKEWFAKNKLKVFITIGVLVLLVSCVVSGIYILKDKTPTVVENETDETYAFKHQQYEAPGELNNYDDIGLMISDCDSEKSFKQITNATFTSREDEYVQGTGAMKMLALRYKDKTPWAHLEPVDISAYEKGSVHVAVYVNDPSLLGEKSLCVELTSGGRQDKDELGWYISPAVLEPGWNEVYLGIEDAKRVGNPDLTNINYFRVYANSSRMGLKVYMDAIYATDTPGTDIAGPTEYATTKPGYLLDFDTIKGLNSDGSLSTIKKKGTYKEGEAAVQIKNPNLVWFTANMKPINLTAYEDGKISFWLHINDAAYVKDSTIVMELTSSGRSDRNEIYWTISGNSLQTGWNEVKLGISAGKSAGGGIDLSSVNYCRIYSTDCNKSVEVIIDAMKLNKMATRVPEDGLIVSCDSRDEFFKVDGSITNVAGEYKEGTGALKLTQADMVWCKASLEELVDISKFAEGGISLWIYMDDVSKLANGLQFELSSSGTYDKDEYQWQISGMKNGWNEVRLAFEDAVISGNPDLTHVNFWRLTGKISGTATVIIDDVRAVQDASEIVPAGTTNDATVAGMIFSGDSLKYVKAFDCGTYAITRENGEFLQGTGAFKSIGAGQKRLQIQLKEAKDLSAYKEGGIELSLYIEDKSQFTSEALFFEISSAGKADKEELCWTIKLTSLKNGWNTITLPFEDASKTGEIDLQNVNFTRLFTHKAETNKELELIVDNIHAVLNAGEEVPEGTTVDTDVEGMIFSGDSLQYVKVSDSGRYEITRAEGEFVQGTGAFKSTGAGQKRLQAKLKEARDLSAYKNGYIELSLYVEDKSEFVSQALFLELTSAGKADSEELCWTIKLASLENGWNTLKLPFANAATTGEIDYENVNFVRLFSHQAETSEDIVLIIDYIHAVQNEKAEETPTDDTAVEGMIFSGDSYEYVTVKNPAKHEITNVEGEFLQGTGAFKATGTSEIWLAAVLKETRDISAYEKDGIHISINLSNPNLITSEQVTVELGSGGNTNTNLYKWKINTESLVSGWNELYLDFDSIFKEMGNVDLSAINWLRIYAQNASDLTIIIDDVRAISNPANTWIIYQNKTIDKAMLQDASLNINLEKTTEDMENLSLYIRMNIPEDVYSNAVADTWRIKFSNSSEYAGEVYFAPDITAAGVYEHTFSFTEMKDSTRINLAQAIKSCRIWNNGSNTSLKGVVIEEMKIVYTEPVEEEKTTSWIIYENKTIETKMLKDASLNINLEKTSEDMENLSLYIKMNIPEDVYANAVADTWRIKFSNSSDYTGEVYFAPNITSAGVYEYTFSFAEMQDSTRINLAQAIKSCRIWNNGGNTSLQGVVIEEMKIVYTEPAEEELSTTWSIYENKTIETKMLKDASLDINLEKTSDDMENLSLYVKMTIPEDVYTNAVADTWRIKFSNSSDYTGEVYFAPNITSAGVYEYTFSFAEMQDSTRINLAQAIKSCRIWNNGGNTSLQGVVIEEMKIIYTPPVAE